MTEYSVLFADRSSEPRVVSFNSNAPLQALTVAQRHCCPAHLFRDGDYLCTIEHWGGFWIISKDPAGARAVMFPRPLPQRSSLAAATIIQIPGPPKCPADVETVTGSMLAANTPAADHNTLQDR